MCYPEGDSVIFVEGHLILDRVLLIGQWTQILHVHLVRSPGQKVLNICVVEYVRLEQRIIFGIWLQPAVGCLGILGEYKILQK